jgi:predicted RNase H-like HicB family nuclease
VAKLTFTVDIHSEPDGSFWAEVEELPGCFASGFDPNELKEAVEEAMRLWLPEGITFDHLRWDPDPTTLLAPKKSSARKPASSAPRRKTHKKTLVCA